MIVQVMYMKEIMKKTAGAAGIATLLYAAWYCMRSSEEVGIAVSEAAERCWGTVIPSLYAMMIVSGLIVRSGITGCLPQFFGRIGRLLWGMDGEVFPVFLFSMLAGYPVGTKMLCAMYSEGRIDKHRAELFCGVCFGAGPAFISGCIAGQLYGSAAAGRTILLSTVIADVILAFAVSFISGRSGAPREERSKPRISGGMLTDCVLSGGRAMADICLMIIAFAAAAAVLDGVGAVSAAGNLVSSVSGMPGEVSEQLVRSFLDITAVSGLPKGNYALLPWISGLTAFGGVCVLFQTAAVSRGRLNMLPAVIMRAAAGALSFFVCRGLMPLTLDGEAVEAAAMIRGAAYKAENPVPSLLLGAMTLILLRETRRKER